MAAGNIKKAAIVSATVAVGLVCPFLLLFIGMGLGGAGHGTGFFFYLAGSPVSVIAPFGAVFIIAPFFWLLVTVLLIFRRSPTVRILLVSLMIAHYAGIPILLFNEDLRRLGKICVGLAPLVLGYLALYVAPQLVLWHWIKKARQESAR